MHSVTTLSIDFESTCSSRFGNELNVESVPLNLATTIRAQRKQNTHVIALSPRIRGDCNLGNLPMDEDDEQ